MLSNCLLRSMGTRSRIYFLYLQIPNFIEKSRIVRSSLCSFNVYMHRVKMIDNRELMFLCKQIKEIILPEFQEMMVAHVATIGSEIASATNVYFSEGLVFILYLIFSNAKCSIRSLKFMFGWS